ncbi:hypothetical protein CAL65_02405 [Alkalilimnicola ehrlichii]|uniref:POTRA domain-containing protein n=1 Tax=Alkalilimnicola ehrlichii TaxID=351052 RepID=A0A3E0X308_9GAMM|nr:hypothetical protein CAL65_02405 [Alkalilimnicola ehrlichii]
MLAVLCILPVGVANANEPSSPADLGAQEFIRQQERERRLREQQEPQPNVQLEVPAIRERRSIPVDETPCFEIDRILLVGDDAEAFLWALRAADLPGDPATGRCLGAEGISLVMSRVQNAVIARGYITTRVLAAPQDLTQGTLTLTLLPGRVNEIRPAPGTTARAPLRNALPMAPGDLLNLRDLEQGLENLKRLPSADADIQVAPVSGLDARPGQSDLLVLYEQRLPWRVSLSVDDSGSRSTGKYQGSGTLAYDNLLNLNDLMYVSFNHDLGGGDSGKRGSRGHTFHYSLPYGYWLLSATHSNGRYYQSVAGLNQTYIYSGRNRQSELKLSRLLWRNATNKFSGHVRGFHRQARNYIDDTEVEVQRRVTSGWEMGLHHRMYLGNAALDAGLNYRRGTGALGALPAPEEAFGEGTSRFKIVNADFNLAVPLQLGSRPLRYNLSGRLQVDRSPLSPQERFAIGGRYTVRGFDGESSLTGERGLLLRNELGVALSGGRQELYTGLDFGRVDGPSADYLVSRNLAGAAMGLRGAWLGVRYDIFAGVPLYKPDKFDTAGSTAGFNLNYAF